MEKPALVEPGSEDWASRAELAEAGRNTFQSQKAILDRIQRSQSAIRTARFNDSFRTRQTPAGRSQPNKSLEHGNIERLLADWNAFIALWHDACVVAGHNERRRRLGPDTVNDDRSPCGRAEDGIDRRGFFRVRRSGQVGGFGAAAVAYAPGERGPSLLPRRMSPSHCKARPHAPDAHIQAQGVQGGVFDA